MRVPTLVEEDLAGLDGSEQFALAAATLATAAEALAAAARAMVEVAQVASITTRTRYPIQPETSLIPEAEIAPRDEVQLGGTDSSSEVSLPSNPEYDDEDFILKDTAVQTFDPVVPCSSSPMSISQLRFALPRVHMEVADEKNIGCQSEVVSPFTEAKPAVAHTSTSPLSDANEISHIPVPVSISGTHGATARPPETGGSAERRLSAKVDIGLHGSSDTHTLARAQPKLPWGRHYIEMPEFSDIVPFIASMALQNTKTICIVRTRMAMAHYVQILQSLTGLTVTYPKNPSETALIEKSLQALRDTSIPTILLLGHESLSCALIYRANPDCVLHWGVPLNLARYVQQVSLLGIRTRSCLIAPPGEELGGLVDRKALEYGITAYPEATLKGYLGPASLFKAIHALSYQKLYGDSTPFSSSVELDEKSGERVLQSPIDSSPTAACVAGILPSPATCEPPTAIIPMEPSNPVPSPNSVFSPKGQYFITLDDPLDTVPLIAYLASRNNRTICFISDADSNAWDGYETLLASLSGLNLMSYRGGDITGIKKAMQSFKMRTSGILLRPTKGWDDGFAKSIANCAIHCGMPRNPLAYQRQCSTNVAHTYILLTQSERLKATKIPAAIVEYPGTSCLNDKRPSSALGQLRYMAENILKDMSEPALPT